MSDALSRTHSLISREMFEDRMGMTDTLRLKLMRLPRPGKGFRKITPKEFETLCRLYSEPDEDGRGSGEYKGHAIAYNREKVWRY